MVITLGRTLIQLPEVLVGLLVLDANQSVKATIKPLYVLEVFLPNGIALVLKENKKIFIQGGIVSNGLCTLVIYEKVC